MATADLDTGDISTPDPFKQRGPGRPPKAQAQAAASGEKVKITIPKTKDQTRDVFVSVNGTPYLLQRGVHIEVPKAVATALELAVQTEYEEVVDPITGRKELRPQQTMSVPFSYV